MGYPIDNPLDGRGLRGQTAPAFAGTEARTSWTTVTPLLLTIACHDKAGRARAYARQEFDRMARLADAAEAMLDTLRGLHAWLQDAPFDPAYFAHQVEAIGATIREAEGS